VRVAAWPAVLVALDGDRLCFSGPAVGSLLLPPAWHDRPVCLSLLAWRWAANYLRQLFSVEMLGSSASALTPSGVPVDSRKALADISFFRYLRQARP